MISNFWAGIGNKLVDPWIASVLTPAFVFWAGGILAWVTRFGWMSLEPFSTQFVKLPFIAQIAVLIGGLLLLVVSSTVVQQLDMPVIRLLEGYWPGWFKWIWRLGRQFKVKWLKLHTAEERMEKAEKRWQELETKKHKQGLSPEENEEQVNLDQRLRLVPAQPELRMPTKLGNILRIAETRPVDKYGLDPIICWPRLWLLLPDNAKTELGESRKNLDTAARLLLWGILFLIWTIWAWWALLVGLIIAIWAYRWILTTAIVYGDLLESAFDLHRFALYEALHWPLPTQPTDESKKGVQLTAYIYRGTVDEPITFQVTEEKKKES
jgi:hypothetical protein